MRKNKVLIVLAVVVVVFGVSYYTKQKKEASVKTYKKTTNTTVSTGISSVKNKVKNKTYPEAKKKTLNWFKKLDFNLEVLIKKQYKIQKHLSEYLGLANILYRVVNTKEEKEEIKKYIHKAYEFTLQPSYHNLASLDNKAFKANSMSYLRILFLLDNLDFDTSFYKNQVLKIKTRLDNHLKQRGDWQKWAFDNYYTALGLDKPAILNKIHYKKGIVGRKISAEKYNLNQAYELTHLVFAAYNYGASKRQNKFDFSDVYYIKETLDLLSKRYRQKNNRDILSELVTCMVLIGSKTKEFKTATNYLLSKQNKDGSWGNYEKYKGKYGDLISIKLYLHTTLVVFESLALQFEK